MIAYRCGTARPALYAAATCLLAVAGGCARRDASSAAPAAPAAPASAPAGTAELDASWDAPRQTLTVELRNTGTTPITVDRELVLLVDIDWLDANGQPIGWQESQSVPKPKSFAGRFVTIQPGGKLTRTVRRAGPMRDFVWGWLTSRFEEGSYHLPNSYEVQVSTPRPGRASAILVRYGPGGFMYDDNIRFYTGKTMDELGLYQGPLEARIAPR